MKKKVLLGTIMSVALLTACNDESQKTDKIALLESENETLTKKVEGLEQQLIQSSEVAAELEPTNTTLNAASEDTYTFKVLVQVGQSDYQVEQRVIEKDVKEDKYKQGIELFAPQIPVKNITYKSDDVIIINFDPNYVYSENMTSTGHLAMYMDALEYGMFVNFPEIKGYYLYADGKPTAIAESSEFVDMIENVQPDYENFYFEFDGE